MTSAGVGAVVGGLLAMRVRPARPLVASIVAAAPLVLQLTFLALHAPVWLQSVASFCGGVGVAVHLTLWFTVFQREVPEQAQSRVSSYDALGSLVLLPLGSALAGPVAAGIGEEATLLGAAAVCITCWAVMLAIPSVWTIRAAPRELPAPASAAV